MFGKGPLSDPFGFRSARTRRWGKVGARAGTHLDADAATPNDRGTVALLDEQFEKQPGFLAGFAHKVRGDGPQFKGGALRSAIDSFFKGATR